MALSRKLWLCQGLTDPRERLEVALRECFYDLGNLPKEMVRQEWDGPSPDQHVMNGLHEIGGDMPGESAVRIRSRIRTMKGHIAIGVPIMRQSCTKSRRVACYCAGY